MHVSYLPPPTSSRWTRRSFLKTGAVVSAAFAGRGVFAADSAKQPELAFARSKEALQLNYGPRTILRYVLQRPGLGGASAESAAYVHPLATPSGLVVTEVGPDDHRHHRGIFCGWVEMHGPADADFWGWGEPAPARGRRIVNVSVDAPPPALGYARFQAVNHWEAESTRVLTEEVRIGAGLRDGGTILDIAARYTAEAEVTLARWAFGGFAVRVRKDAKPVAIGAEGPVALPAPVHTDPASNWPAAPWHGLHLRFADGKEATVVVAGRATNPVSTWHVVAGIGLINPCITAPREVLIQPGKPLALRYRVMAFDGPPKLDLINRLADVWYRGAQG
jgi:hypothetical protein